MAMPPRIATMTSPTLVALTPRVHERWRHEDGSHLDPWIRVHERLGATILGPAEKSMIISGTVNE